MSRLFIAAFPPNDVLDWLEDFDRPTMPRGRWTTRDQWHVTLQFLGDVDEAAAADALASIDAPPTEVLLQGEPMVLGRANLVLPVVGLDGLAFAVHRATTSVVDEPDQHGFFGHLTIGRPKDAPVAKVALGGLGARDPIAFTVDALCLVSSELRPGGSVYTVVDTKPLTGS